MNLILAQASLDGAMSEGLGIIAKFLFIIAVVVIAHGGWQVRSGNADELREELGGPSPSLDGAIDLPLLDAVVKESMRILPPVPLQIRVAQCDTTIAGHNIPKGTRVMLNTFLTNRTPELYPEGDVFRPERWFTIAPTAFEFPVFSGGPHSCPGYWFGLTTIKIALAAILTRYRMSLPRDARIDYRVQPTMRPLQSISVLLERVLDLVRDTGS